MTTPDCSGLVKITGIQAQVKNKNRVNISIDGKYRFSLDIFQLNELGVRVGMQLTKGQLDALEYEGVFGKLYARALEYCLMRPRSIKEMRDYLWKKTLTKKYKTKTGEVRDRPGVPPALTERVLERLIEKSYLDDVSFARWWVEYRHQIKGVSVRKLQTELMTKGVSRSIIEDTMATSTRQDEEELKKVIAKKQKRYQDKQKFIQYLLRQGFLYSDIQDALEVDEL